MRLDVMNSNKVFGWIFFGTTLLLFVPFLLMQFRVPIYDPGSGFGVVNWNFFDFLIMGTLIFSIASLFVIIVRRIKLTSHQILVAIGLLLIFLWLWAELAVGIFTNWGN